MADLLGEHRNKYLTDESLHDEAPAFDVVEDMPKLYDAVFNMPGMSDDGRIQLWMIVLIDMMSLGRASDLTDEYCPKLKQVGKKRGVLTDNCLS